MGQVHYEISVIGLLSRYSSLAYYVVTCSPFDEAALYIERNRPRDNQMDYCTLLNYFKLCVMQQL